MHWNVSFASFERLERDVVLPLRVALTTYDCEHLVTSVQRDIDKPSELISLREELRLGQADFAERLGVSRQHLSKIENGKVAISPKVRRAARELQGQWKAEKPLRWISLVSWAQAGFGVDFEELPMSWRRQIPCDCSDDRAYALELQGDSMEPKYWAGDLAVVMPSVPPRSGRLVVARLENEGVVFKLFTSNDSSLGSFCVLTSYNLAYPALKVDRTEIHWIHPVYRIVTNVWD